VLQAPRARRSHRTRKDKKILVFKYKNKTRYRRRHGHRQDFTRLAIRQILTEGQEATGAEEKPKRPARRAGKPKAKASGRDSPRSEVDAAPAAAAPPRRRKWQLPKRLWLK
jgi:hypothetical protein